MPEYLDHQVQAVTALRLRETLTAFRGLNVISNDGVKSNSSMV